MSRPLRAAALVAPGLVLLFAACSGRAPVPLRPEPVPYADTLPIEEPPARSPSEAGRLFEISVGEAATRPFDLRRLAGARQEALNVTRYDDVVNSAWFEHRIDGPGGLTPAEVARGPADTPPADSGALTVVAGKSEGISPGFTVRDAAGHRYLFKFDPRGHLHLASSADVITSRLLWAAGYHVPEEYKVVFDPDRLVIGEGAEVTLGGVDRPMEPAHVREILARTDSLPDGRYLALASRFVPGTPKGPFLFSGTRDTDPNDHYRHEHRRELRGLHVISAWLNHVDVRFANTLDAYVEPGYLRHYLIDMAASLGSGTIRAHRPREGAEHNFDFWPSLARLVTLGFYRVGWEGRDPEPLHPAVGWMRVEGFEPGGWKANWPNPAFWNMTPRDAYWAAKLVAAFRPAHLRAAVEAGRLPDAAATDTLVAALRHRRDRTVEHWFRAVTPLEEPELRSTGGEGGRRLELTFRDLALEEGVAEASGTRYRWRFRHPGLGREARGTGPAADARRQTLAVALPPGRESAGQVGGGKGGVDAALRRADPVARIEVTAVRAAGAGRAAVVHLLWRGPEAGYEVAGLEH